MYMHALALKFHSLPHFTMPLPHSHVSTLSTEYVKIRKRYSFQWSIKLVDVVHHLVHVNGGEVENQLTLNTLF